MKALEGTRVALWAEEHWELAEIGRALSRLGCQVERVESLEELLEQQRSHPHDLVLARICRHCRWPLDLLSRCRASGVLPPIVLAAGTGEVDLYLEGMKRGAFDCIALPPDERELVRIVSGALQACPLGRTA